MWNVEVPRTEPFIAPISLQMTSDTYQAVFGLSSGF
jgi:hypothetical protein